MSRIYQVNQSAIDRRNRIIELAKTARTMTEIANIEGVSKELIRVVLKKHSPELHEQFKYGGLKKILVCVDCEKNPPSSQKSGICETCNKWRKNHNGEKRPRRHTHCTVCLGSIGKGGSSLRGICLSCYRKEQYKIPEVRKKRIEATIKYTKKNWERTLEKQREYMREYSKRPYVKERMRRYAHKHYWENVEEMRKRARLATKKFREKKHAETANNIQHAG